MEEKVDRKFKEIDNATNEMQRDLEKKYIRQLQASSLRKGAECCENMSYSAEEVQRCIESTQRSLSIIQSNMKSELDRFQSRIQRCIMTCQDQVRDISGQGMSEEIAKEKFSSCLCACADEHITLIPQIKTRLIDVINQNKY